jgi:pyruvate/2-oxoglutarate dehydrogenase complex dihydrolipoamide acyltransferase (E2) component
MSHTQQPFPKQRQHTLLFLEQSHAYRPVSIDTDVEMTEVVRHRQQSGKRYSYLAYFIQAMAQVVAEYPASCFRAW